MEVRVHFDFGISGYWDKLVNMIDYGVKALNVTDTVSLFDQHVIK